MTQERKQPIDSVDAHLRKQIVVTAGCWFWQGCTCKDGYGRTGRRGKRVHRVVYEQVKGEKLSPAIVLRHSCDERLCCNPAHLLKGTHSDNHKDMEVRGRMVVGEKHHKAKLSEVQIGEIRASKDSGATLAMKYGVSKASISLIKSNQRRKHEATN